MVALAGASTLPDELLEPLVPVPLNALPLLMPVEPSELPVGPLTEEPVDAPVLDPGVEPGVVPLPEMPSAKEALPTLLPGVPMLVLVPLSLAVLPKVVPVDDEPEEGT